MKKISLLILFSLVFTTSVYATSMSKVETRVSVNDGTTDVESTGLITKYFTNGATEQKTVSLAAGFNNISIPSGAKGIFVDVGSSTNMILKGVTADKGISLDATTPVLLPLSADGSATVGISNMSASSQSVKVYFF